MDVSPPPQADDPIITQFRPVQHQWELNDENINRIDPETGRSILHNYCRYINTTPLEVWRYLIETKCCDVNAQDNSKDTSLHDAILFFDPNKGGDITVLTYLINQKNINPNIKDKNGHTIFHLACICKIGDDSDDQDEDGSDDVKNSDEGLEDSVIQNQKADTNLCQIVEAIAERCIQQVLDETT